VFDYPRRLAPDSSDALRFSFIRFLPLSFPQFPVRPVGTEKTAISQDASTDQLVCQWDWAAIRAHSGSLSVEVACARNETQPGHSRLFCAARLTRPSILLLVT
jgi:hypothetical protein